jgi:hypothetical protein
VEVKVAYFSASGSDAFVLFAFIAFFLVALVGAGGQ